MVRWFAELGRTDVGLVGGKNAGLGELTRNLARAGVCVPEGFALTAEAYHRFIQVNGLNEVIAEHIGRLHGGTDLRSATGRTAGSVTWTSPCRSGCSA